MMEPILDNVESYQHDAIIYMHSNNKLSLCKQTYLICILNTVSKYVFIFLYFFLVHLREERHDKLG